MQRNVFPLIRTATVLLSAACLRLGAAAPLNACDLNSDGSVTTADVTLAVAMSTGAVTPCTATVIGSGICNVVMVQRVINASQGGSCGRTATLSWTASQSPNVIGYKLYRGTAKGGPYTLLLPTLVTGTTFVDTSVQAGLTYYYVVTAINASNVESVYSAQATAVIPSS